MLWLASARTVLVRSSAEMPVVNPCLTSTDTVKAVPSGASFDATIGSSRSRRASSGVSGRADDPGGVADDHGHLVRRAMHRRDEQVALVLAVVVVDDDDDFAARERLDDLGDAIGHATLQPSPLQRGRVSPEGRREREIPVPNEMRIRRARWSKRLPLSPLAAASRPLPLKGRGLP